MTGRATRFAAGCGRSLAARSTTAFEKEARRQPPFPSKAECCGSEAHATFQQIADGTLESDSDEPEQGPSEETEKQLLFRRALELVQRDFEERTWQAFWKVVVDGMSPKDAGEELDMKPGTVRVAKSRVLARLRQEFGDLM